MVWKRFGPVGSLAGWHQTISACWPSWCLWGSHAHQLLLFIQNYHLNHFHRWHLPFIGQVFQLSLLFFLVVDLNSMRYRTSNQLFAVCQIVSLPHWEDWWYLLNCHTKHILLILSELGFQEQICCILLRNKHLRLHLYSSLKKLLQIYTLEFETFFLDTS